MYFAVTLFLLRQDNPNKLQFTWHLLGKFFWEIYDIFTTAFTKNQQMEASAISCHSQMLRP